MSDELRNRVQARTDRKVQLDLLRGKVVLGPKLEDLVEGLAVGHQLFVNVQSFSRLKEHLPIFPVGDRLQDVLVAPGRVKEFDDRGQPGIKRRIFVSLTNNLPQF